MNIEDHPTVKRMRAITGTRIENEEGGIDAGWRGAGLRYASA